MKQKLKSMRSVRGLMLLLTLVFSSFAGTGLNAQQIKGVVADSSGTPLPGVSVMQKGTQNGTSTDFDGKYSIDIVVGQKTLVFSSLGFEKLEKAIGNLTVLNVTLEDAQESLDEIVIIGYAAVSRKKLLGALGSVKAEAIQQATPVSAFDAVQGRIAGVQISTNGGPGGGFDISIRGVSTFGAGTSPLYVVDGQQLENIDNLDPNDIASLEILKDGATAAIYGSKAANGVVLITTKNGKSGKIKIDVNTTTGINMLVGDIEVANARQRITYVRRRSNILDPRRVTLPELDSLSVLNRNSFDLQDLTTRPAVRQQTNLAVSGGTEKARFYWNTGFLEEKGIILNSSYKRINTLLKVDVDLHDKLKVGTKINLSFEERNGISEINVLSQIISRVPNFPVFNPDGSFVATIAGRRNPLAQAELRTQKNRSWITQVFSFAEWEILPKLKIKSTLGINNRIRMVNGFVPQLLQSDPNDPPTGSFDSYLDYDIQQENFINYANVWGDHSFSAFAGMSIQKWSLENFQIDSQFISDDVKTFNNSDPEFVAIDTDRTENRKHNLISQFAGFNYDFKSKYLFSATVRRDGSSRFGENNKFGYFPAASAGWRISKEAFLEDNNVINNLLLKGSFGIIGNERIADYAFTSALVPGSGYTGAGVAQSRLGNPDLSWESTTSINLGFELDMFRNRLNIGIDFWEKRTTDLLANVPLPEESGFSSILQNVGAVNNKGVDISLGGTVIKTKDFSWDSSFNISFFKNEVTALSGGTPFESGTYLIEEGQPIGNIFGHKNLGVYQYAESNAYNDDGVRLMPVVANGDVVYTDHDSNATTPDVASYTLNGAAYTGAVNQMTVGSITPQGGDVIWSDLNNDFQIDAANDRQIIGNGLPEYFGGFTNTFKYKNFSLSMLFDYSIGADIFKEYDEIRNSLRTYNVTPNPEYIDNAWLREGDVSIWPRLRPGTQNRLRPNSFYIEQGDYVKLRFIRLNYSLPKSALESMSWLNSVALNLAINNVLTWTNYTGYNPELGRRGNALQPNRDRLRYPNDREFILGIRIGL